MCNYYVQDTNKSYEAYSRIKNFAHFNPFCLLYSIDIYCVYGSLLRVNKCKKHHH